jgi:hypothetical protein
MTKLEELRVAYDAATEAADAADDAWNDAYDAYYDELKRTQEENSND